MELRRSCLCSVPRATSPSSPLVRGHDGHAWRRCHPGWRGPRALPALQSELRSHAQGGWAPRPVLGTSVLVLRATPPRPRCLETLGLPGPSAFLAASALDSALPSPRKPRVPESRGRVETQPLGSPLPLGTWAVSARAGRGSSEVTPQPNFLLPHSGHMSPQDPMLLRKG